MDLQDISHCMLPAPVMGTPVRGPSRKLPSRWALLQMRGSMSGRTPNSSRLGACQARVRSSIKLVLAAFVTSVTNSPAGSSPGGAGARAWTGERTARLVQV